MINPRDADHAVGLELQIEELVEQRKRAEVQGRPEDVSPMDEEIASLHTELAETAERAAVATDDTASVDPPVD